MRISSAAEYSIQKYQENYNMVKENTEKLIQESLETKNELADFYKKLEELQSKNKKGILTKDSVDIYV